MKVVDKRSYGGNLTVLGKKSDIEPVIKEVEKLYGAYGKFSESLKAAHNGPGWWTKCDK